MEEGLLVVGERKTAEVEVLGVSVMSKQKKAFSCLGEPEVSSQLAEGVLS